MGAAAAALALAGSMSVSRNILGLIEMIEAKAAVPFNWRGGADCVSFAALAIKAQTGIDPRGTLRWASKRGALAAVATEGGIEAAIDRRLSRVAPALARRGDIAGVPDAQLGIPLMVVEGAMLVGPGEGGLERQPRSAMVMAWDAMSAVAITLDSGLESDSGGAD